MPKLLVILCIIGLGGAFAFWDNAAPPAGIRAPIITPAPAAPKIRFTALDGTPYTLSQFKGKTVLINFWATWCTPCIIEMPELLALAQREKDNIILLALSVDDDPKIIEQFLKTMPDLTQNVIIGQDLNKDISEKAFGTTAYPETYIIDKTGNIQKKISGITDWLGADIKKLIETP